MRVYAGELRYWKIEDFIPPDSYRERNSYCVIGTMLFFHLRFDRNAIDSKN
jgi:hypothetical protein